MNKNKKTEIIKKYIYKIWQMIYHINNYKRVIKLSWSILLFIKTHQIAYFH